MRIAGKTLLISGISGALLLTAISALAQPPGVQLPNAITPPGAVALQPVDRSSVTTHTAVPLSFSAWTALGPAALSTGGAPPANFFVSGRVTGIAAASANNIFLSAAGGGVWNTTNGGTSWNPLTDGQATLSMGAIAIAPNNVIYAGTGEANNGGDNNYGLGILVSRDAGATWALTTGPGNAFNRLTTSQIATDQSDATGNTAYAAMADFGTNGICCANTGIWKTTNGGTTWTNTTTGIDASRPWSAVVIDPNNRLNLYAAHGDPFGGATNGVYRSTDGGTTWALLPGAPNAGNVGRIALAIGTNNSSVLYVAVANQITTGNGALFGFFRSNNADTAATFTNLTAGTPDFLGGANGAGQGWYDIAVAVDPANSANVYCAGVETYAGNINAIIKSTNSGVAWTDITTGSNGINPHTDHHALTFDGSGHLLDGNDGGIYRYDPATNNWTALNNNLNTIQFFGIGTHPTNVALAIGASQDNGTEITTGSINWLETDGGDGAFSKFSQTACGVGTCTGNGRAYKDAAVGSFGPVNFFRRSDDGGNTWVGKTTGLLNPNSFLFVPPFAVDPANGDHLLFGGDRVYETTNAANLWIPISTPGLNGWTQTGGISALGLSPFTAQTVYAATAGHIFVTTNHGTAWTEHSIAGTPSIQDLEVDPNDATSQTAYAVVNQFVAGGNVFKTINGGTNWTNISGNLPPIPASSIQIDTDAVHTLYLANDLGVYSSTNGGTTWTLFGAGLPNAQALQIELNRNLTPHVLAVGTHGRGMWEIQTGPAALLPPTISKAFNPVSITSGGTSLVTLTLTNPNASILTGGAFTDNLANMSAAGGPVGGTCVGTTPISLVATATALSFNGITIPASGNCTVTFSVISNPVGINPNQTSGVTTAQTLVAGAASNIATLTVNPIVLVFPTINKAFGPASIVSGGTSLVTLTIANGNVSSLTGGTLTDTLVNMSAVAGSVGGTCAGTTPGTLAAGATALSFSGITIPPGGCTVTFSVTSSNVGINGNVTSGVTTAQTPIGPPSNIAFLNVTPLTPPTISKAFNPASIVSGGTSVVTLTLSNANASSLTGGAFTDNLANMSAVAGLVGGTCAGTTPNTLVAGATALSFSGITIPASSFCTVTFSITSSNVGPNINVTSGVTTAQTTVGTPSNPAFLTVNPLASPTISKAFNPASIASGGTSVVTLTLSNTNASSLTGGAFSDLLVNMSAVGGPVGGTCVGTNPNTLGAGATALLFNSITIPAGGCTVTFSVTSSTIGANNNQTTGVSTNQTIAPGVPSNIATLTVTALAPPTISKAFNPVSIVSGGTSLVTLTLSNTNASSLTGAAFADTLVNMSAIAGPVGGTCIGTAPNTLAAGATLLSFTGITVPTGGCTITFSLTSSNVGVNPNQTSGVTTTQTPGPGLQSNIAILVVTALASPTISKAFSPASIVSGGTSVVTLTLSNTNASNLTGAAFADFLVNMSAIAGPVGGTCAGTAPNTLAAGATALSFSGITIPPGSCTVTFSITSSNAGANNNFTSSVITAQAPVGPPSNLAVLTVGAPGSPTISKAFNPASIVSGGTSAVTLTLSNTNPSSLTGAAFADTLVNMSAIAGPVGGTCAGTAPNALAAGATALSFTGITIPPGGCTVTFSVTSSTLGANNNVTSGVTTTQTATGPASNIATLTVSVGDPFQVSYASNLSAGDSFVDISNSGTMGAGLQSGTTAAITGAICANVYAFTPDEQLVSCCSCPVTPNGLVSLSVLGDLASNTLTPAVPTALVIKLLATVPVAGSCANSAAGVTTATLATGMKSFGTTIHATPAAGTYGVTEKPFSIATLSPGELTRIGTLCNFILANGSGFGVCRTCRLGGLGGARQ